MEIPTWEGILQWLLPFGIFEDIREDLRELFEEIYRQHPVIRLQYAKKNIDEIQGIATTRASEAREYQPSGPIKEVNSALTGLVSVIQVGLFMLLIVGALAGVPFLVQVSRVGLGILDSLQSLLLSVILGGPLVIAIAAAGLIVWLQLIAASGTIVRVFNDQLVIGPKDIVRMDNRPELAGTIVWNSSLVGTGALKLVNIFSILLILSAMPKWDPYRFITSVLRNNMDAFVKIDGWWDAARVLFHRLYG